MYMNIIKSSGGFIPSDIDGLQLWGKKNTQWYQDVAGTIPSVTTNDSIARVDDQSDNSNNLTQATPAKVPKLSSLGGILLDGIDDNLNIANPALSFERTQPLTFFAKFRRASTSGTQELMSKRLSSGSIRGYSLTFVSTALRFALTNTVTTNVLSIDFGNFIINTDFYIVLTSPGDSNANNVSPYVNGFSVSKSVVSNSLSATIISSAVFCLGMINNTGSAFNGQIFEYGIYDSVLNAQNITLLNTYLASV